MDDLPWDVIRVCESFKRLGSCDKGGVLSVSEGAEFADRPTFSLESLVSRTCGVLGSYPRLREDERVS